MDRASQGDYNKEIASAALPKRPDFFGQSEQDSIEDPALLT